MASSATLVVAVAFVTRCLAGRVEKHVDGEEAIVPSSPIEPDNVMLSLWGMVGASPGPDVIIFAITACGAFALRRTPKAKKVKEGLASKAIYAEVASIQHQQPRDARKLSEAHWTSDRSAVVSSAARLFTDIIHKARLEGELKNQAFLLYNGLKDMLRINVLDIHEVAALSTFDVADMYFGLVRSCMRASQSYLIPKLIDDMVRYGVPRTLSFYEAAMKQLAGELHHATALDVYDRLEADGLTPSLVTASCLVSFAEQVGDFTRARHFFEQLSKRTTPSIRAYMTMLRMHAKMQDWPAARARFREMQSRGVPIDSLALNIVLGAGVSDDRVEEASELLAEFAEGPSPLHDVVSYNTIIKGYIRRGDREGASKVVELMNQHGIKPNAITYKSLDRRR